MGLSERYEILEALGEGATAVVRRAKDRQTGDIVAIKFLRTEMGSSQDGRNRFEQEAEILESLDSKNLIKVREHGMENGSLYLVMDLLQGRDLASAIESNAFEDETRRRQILVDIGRGILDLHQAGIIHRDLKPQNILLDRRGRAVITDLGLAKLKEPKKVRTRTGVILGTPGFLAPEILMGKKATPKVDVYSFGIVIYCVYTGRSPFHSTDLGPLLQEQLAGIQSAALLELPEDIAPLVRQMLRATPDDRPDAGQVLDSLSLTPSQDPVQRRATISVSEEIPGAATGGWQRGTHTRAFVLRKPVAASAVLASVLLGVMGASWGLFSMEEQKDPEPEFSVDDRVLEQLDRLRTFSLRSFMKNALAEALGKPKWNLKALTGRLVRLRIREWRETVRPVILRHLQEQGIASAYSILRSFTQTGWLTDFPQDKQKKEAASKLRRDYLHWLWSLDRLNRLDLWRGGDGQILPGLSELISPAVSIHPLPRFKLRGDQLPDAEPLFREGGHDCEVLTTASKDESFRKSQIRGLRTMENLGGCPPPDEDQIFLKQLKVPFSMAAAPPGPYIHLAIGVYEMRPRSQFEVAVVDGEDRVLARATVHFPRLPDRFLGENQAWDLESHPFPIEIRFHREVLGSGERALRIRYIDLVNELDGDDHMTAVVAGVGLLQRSLVQKTEAL